MEEQWLINEVAIVTGSDSGIGRAMALTPFNQPAIDDPKVREKQVQSIRMKRAAQPEEIADVAVFLASRHARYIHGTTVAVDGGLMQDIGRSA